LRLLWLHWHCHWLLLLLLLCCRQRCLQRLQQLLLQVRVIFSANTFPWMLLLPLPLLPLPLYI
jgi:hypothetical protein